MTTIDGYLLSKFNGIKNDSIFRPEPKLPDNFIDICECGQDELLEMKKLFVGNKIMKVIGDKIILNNMRNITVTHDSPTSESSIHSDSLPYGECITDVVVEFSGVNRKVFLVTDSHKFKLFDFDYKEYEFGEYYWEGFRLLIT